MTTTDEFGRARLDELLGEVRPGPVPLRRLREDGVRARRRRVASFVAAGAVALIVMGVAGVTAWGGLREPAPQFDPAAAGEYAASDGEVCPQEQPQEPGTSGFGTEKPASSTPNLRPPERVWVCQYAPDLGPFNDQQGQRLITWTLEGGAVEVGASDVDAFADALAAVAPGDRDPEQPCTADLGPRWMVVAETAGDLTGFVVDDFGCGDLRLTDDPWSTEPGAARQPGTVPGTFREGAADLSDLAKETWLAGSPEPRVLSMSAGWESYPQAMVSGELSVESGCVLVGDFVVVWPPRTTWDASTKTLVFAAGLAPGTIVRIGDQFRGGGGSLPDQVLKSELGPDGYAWLTGCLAETGASGVVFAYPEG